MKKIDHTPAFDTIALEVAKTRQAKIAVITLFTSALVLTLIAGVIIGVSTENDTVVSINLLLFPIFIGMAFLSFSNISNRSTLMLKRNYLVKAQTLLSEFFELDLSLAQVDQLGLGQDWRALTPGAAMGSTATLSDYPAPVGRYHSLITVKSGEDSVILYETQGETTISQIL